MSDKYPQGLFRLPGNDQIVDREPFGGLVVHSDEEYAAAVDAGWKDTPDEARAAFVQPVPDAVPDPAPDPVPAVSDIPPDDAPPTRDEMERKAAELGIKVDRRWSDKRLGDAIAAALKV